MVLLTGVFLVILLVSIYFPSVVSKIALISPDELNTLISSGEDVVVLDVRAPEHFGDQRGHVPGAVNIPSWDLRGRIKEIEYELENYRGHVVVVICQSGVHAPGASRILKKAGMERVLVVKGGMKRWYKENLPTKIG